MNEDWIVKEFLFIILNKVSVSVNGIPSKCTGECNFQWLQNSTPLVTNIDISNRQSIVLTGNGFDPIMGNNIVSLGNFDCKITSATLTQLVCTPG